MLGCEHIDDVLVVEDQLVVTRAQVRETFLASQDWVPALVARELVTVQILLGLALKHVPLPTPLEVIHLHFLLRS